MESFHKKEIALTALKHWFEMEKRIFPWRKNPTPYRVWISEIMLQQTRAVVAAPFFERWMRRFSSIGDLSKASEEEVIKLWEGLGYYSRARSLLRGAQYLETHYGGLLPSSYEALLKIPGIGPYTAGAILSFGFRKRAIALDGNVMRVIARLYCYEEEIDTTTFRTFAYEKMNNLLPDTDASSTMEAFIELGATLCNRNPICKLCPLKEICVGYQKDKVLHLPKKKKKIPITYLTRIVPVIFYKNYFLLRMESKDKVMAGLYEFPYFEQEVDLEKFYPGKLKKKNRLLDVSHSFTRYKALLVPTIWEAEEKKEIKEYNWIYYEKMESLPFSAGHRKILKQVRGIYAHIAH